MNPRAEVLQHELQEVEEQLQSLKVALADKPECGFGKGDPAVTRWELDRTLPAQLEARAGELRLNSCSRSKNLGSVTSLVPAGSG